MKRVTSLENVKIGDKFFIHRQYSREVEMVECTRITPKRCEIGRREYVKADGSSWGRGDSYAPIPCLYVVDEESSTIHMEQVNRRAALFALSKVGEKSSTALLLELHAAIKSHEQQARESGVK